ncbi:MAG TPA: ThuA domain-containing protein [Vicinamibacterales bacterium]|nr:ThuA domain-containing protein [Vicinamibacterales bacterium]
MKAKAAFVAAVVTVCALPLVAGQAPAAPAAGAPAAQAPAAPQGRGGGGGGFGGGGNTKVLLITKGHAFDREPFFQLFDQPPVGTSARWTHVEQPAAEIFFEPALAKDYDVFVFYDLNGNQGDRRKPRVDKAGKPVLNKDGSPAFTWEPPPADLVANAKALLRQGKPMVFLHHASASWAHSWPEFQEVMGISCDWGQPIRARGIDHPKSGFFGRTTQTITVVDKAHPITQGLGESFQIVDEAYTCPIFEESVHPLLRTDFTPKDVALNLNSKAKFSNLAAWVKTAENSPIVYIQLGHDNQAWSNPAFRTLLDNAIRWAASPEATAWAKKNPKKIFKN